MVLTEQRVKELIMAELAKLVTQFNLSNISYLNRIATAFEDDNVLI